MDVSITKYPNGLFSVFLKKNQNNIIKENPQPAKPTIFVLDVSGSMGEKMFETNLSKVEVMKESVCDVLKFTSYFAPETNTSIILFNEHQNVIVNNVKLNPQNLDEIIDKIQQTQVTGDTDIFGAFLKTFEIAKEDSNIIFVSDGHDSHPSYFRLELLKNTIKSYVNHTLTCIGIGRVQDYDINLFSTITDNFFGGDTPKLVQDNITSNAFDTVMSMINNFEINSNVEILSPLVVQNNVIKLDTFNQFQEVYFMVGRNASINLKYELNEVKYDQVIDFTNFVEGDTNEFDCLKVYSEANHIFSNAFKSNKFEEEITKLHTVMSKYNNISDKIKFLWNGLYEKVISYYNQIQVALRSKNAEERFEEMKKLGAVEAKYSQIMNMSCMRSSSNPVSSNYFMARVMTSQYQLPPDAIPKTLTNISSIASVTNVQQLINPRINSVAAMNQLINPQLSNPLPPFNYAPLPPSIMRQQSSNLNLFFSKRKVADAICVICMVNKRNIITLPCLHLSMCSNCTKNTLDRCPICMGHINTLKEIDIVQEKCKMCNNNVNTFYNCSDAYLCDECVNAKKETHCEKCKTKITSYKKFIYS